MHGPAPWTETEMLLAGLLGSFHGYMWAKGGGKGTRPKPIDPPDVRWVKARKRSTQYERLIAQAEAVKQQRRG